MNPSNSSNPINSMNPINFLTIDLEDYFQVHAFSNVIRFEEWDKYESRIEHNTFRILDILHECKPNFLSNVPNSLPPTSNLQPQSLDLTPCSMPSALCRPVRATFFCLGWVAERYPHLIEAIKGRGHEIACHGYAHKLIYHQSKEEFREDIRKAKAILENIIGDEVIGYRAPSYSITNKSQWALEILTEEGFKYDSSIFPIHHDFYGFPKAPRFPFLISMNGNNNFEFSLLNFDLQEPQSSVLSPSHSVQPSVNSSNPSNPINSTNSMNPTNSSNSINPSNPATPNSSLDSKDFASNLKRPACPKPFGEGRSAPPTFSDMCASNLKRPAETKPFGEGWSAPPSSNNISGQRSALCAMPSASSIVEFPISTVCILGINLPISGGGYFRLFPYFIIKKGLTRINRIEGMPFIFYLHPWELDDEQPRINGIGLRSRFRHYNNLRNTESKFKKLLRDFNFLPIGEIIQLNNPMNH